MILKEMLLFIAVLLHRPKYNLAGKLGYVMQNNANRNIRHWLLNGKYIKRKLGQQIPGVARLNSVIKNVLGLRLLTK
jgi:hypothetical protein